MQLTLKRDMERVFVTAHTSFLLSQESNRIAVNASLPVIPAKAGIHPDCGDYKFARHSCFRRNPSGLRECKLTRWIPVFTGTTGEQLRVFNNKQTSEVPENLRSRMKTHDLGGFPQPPRSVYNSTSFGSHTALNSPSTMSSSPAEPYDPLPFDPSAPFALAP